MRRLRILSSVLLTLAASEPALAKTLPIPAVSQSLSNWCWLASGEMVFRYLGVPNLNPAGIYQCGIAAVVFGGPCASDCQLCNVGSGTIQVLRDMLVWYPQVVKQVAHVTMPTVVATMTTSALSFANVVEEIDRGRPIVAGISPHSGFKPPGLSEHAVLIVGYEVSGPQLWMIINDPFPYGTVGMPDPYVGAGGKKVGAGRFAVPYEAMIQSLAWQNSVLGIGLQ